MCAQAGFETVIYDINDLVLENALGNIKKLLNKKVETGKWKLTSGQYKDIVKRLVPATDLKEAADADVVIEAIVEDEVVKKQFFADIDKVVSEHTILASNTSGISITKLAGSTQRPWAASK